MTTIIIADEIHREMGQPTDVSVSSIAFWLRGHVGNLNLLIDAEYTISSNGSDFSPELGNEEKAILKLMYLINYYEFKIRENLGAASQTIALEVSSDGATVRSVNKNEISKTYALVKKGLEDQLKDLVRSHGSNDVTFKQVAGDDTVEGTYYSPSNFNRLN